jgi:hypothetical protein
VMTLGRPYLSLSTKNDPFCNGSHKEACTKLAHNQRDSHIRSGNEKIRTKIAAPSAQASRESKTSRRCADARMLLQALRNHQSQNFSHITTGDER